VNHYLYAIVDRMPAAWRPPTNGLGDASVVPRRVDDVVVIGSLLETVPPATPRTLAIHHDIVATVLDAGALLPFRYGTAVPAATLHDWFAAHRAVLDAALGSVRGCVEMSVKLLRLDGALDGRERGESGPGARQLQALADALVERAALPQRHRRQRRRLHRVPGAALRSARLPRPHRPRRLPCHGRRRGPDRTVAALLVRARLRAGAPGAGAGGGRRHRGPAGELTA